MAVSKRNGGKWTEARYRSFITSALRSAFRRWPPRSVVLKKAFIEKKINPASGRLASFYRCAKCSSDFPATGVQIDHIKPIVLISGFDSWDNVITRLYCEQSNLQVLCKACHKVKTAKEQKRRKR